MPKGFYLISGDAILGCAETMQEAQARLLAVLQNGPRRSVYICELLPREYAHWETIG